MQLQDDYFAAYRTLKLTRDAGGVLVVEFHTKGGPFRFTAQGYTELVDAFYRIARDRENKIAFRQEDAGSSFDLMAGKMTQGSGAKRIVIFDRSCFFCIAEAGRSFRLPSAIIGRPSSTKASDLIFERRPAAFQDNVEVVRPTIARRCKQKLDRIIAEGGWSRHEEAYRQSRRRVRVIRCVGVAGSYKWSGRPLRREFFLLSLSIAVRCMEQKFSQASCRQGSRSVTPAASAGIY